jgi:hypothetical protein
MHGVTAAIVAFIFVCVIFPRLVTNRPQYFGALAAVLAVILLDSIAAMLGAGAFRTFAYVMTGLLQIVAILLLILSAGALTPRELGRELSQAYEVIRRGEEEKEVIIPLTGQQPRPREEEPDLPRSYRIDTEEDRPR